MADTSTSNPTPVSPRWVYKDGDRFDAYEILPDGSRGRHVPFNENGKPRCHGSLAEIAAQHLDAMDSTNPESRIIEIVGGYDVPVRYRVTSRVVRLYDARRINIDG